MSEFTQGQRTIVERVIQAWAYGDAQWIAIRKDAVRALLAAYDALRAQPSAGHEAPGCAFCMGHGSGLSPGDLCPKCGDVVPAPPREAGLIAELAGSIDFLRNRPKCMADALTAEQEGILLSRMQRARDRLAEHERITDKRVTAMHDLCDRKDDRIAALQSELAQATARAEQDAKDVARYRWLRKNCQYGFEDHDGPQLIHRNGETGPQQNPRWREQLDAAIDAAIASGTGAK